MVPWQPANVEMRPEVGMGSDYPILATLYILGHMLSMISLGVAGYSPNSAHLWKETCATMKKEVCVSFVLCNYR